MSSKSRSYHVLLIEDDPKQTELYSDLIREVADCQVDVIRRVEASFDWINRFNYHLVVIDTTSLIAPAAGLKLNSLGVLEKIKRISPVTSVILIADNATVDEAVSAIRMGAEDYLSKPFNLESFQLAVKRGLDKKMVLDESSGASSYVNLLNACQMISASLDRGKIFSIVESYLARELKSDHAAIYQLGKAQGSEEKVPVVIAEGKNGIDSDRAMAEILDISLQASNPLAKMTEGDELYRFIDRGQLTPGIFVFRFKCVSNDDFFCVCLSPERPKSIESFESRLRMLRTQIEVTGNNIEHYQGVQRLAYVDDATGLYNTRYLGYILDREIAQAQINSKPFAVLFIDADKFKSINDNYGHLVGTKLLNELGHHLRKYVRETDTIFRYGGDEFIAVLSPCDLNTAKVVAERIRQSVERKSFINQDGLSVKFTVSIGVAIYPDHATSKKTIIDAADHAMYAAKRATRNSVFVAELPEEKASG